jgi:hypothetical protein
VGEGWVVYEAYEVGKKGGNYDLFYFAGKIKIFLYIFMKSLLWEKNKKALILLTHHTYIRVS